MDFSLCLSVSLSKESSWRRSSRPLLVPQGSRPWIHFWSLYLTWIFSSATATECMIVENRYQRPSDDLSQVSDLALSSFSECRSGRDPPQRHRHLGLGRSLLDVDKQERSNPHELSSVQDTRRCRWIFRHQAPNPSGQTQLNSPCRSSLS